MGDETTIRLPQTVADRIKVLATELARHAEHAGIDKNKSALIRVAIQAGMDAVEAGDELPATMPVSAGAMVRYGLRLPPALAQRLPAVHETLAAVPRFAGIKLADVYRLLAVVGVARLERQTIGERSAGESLAPAPPAPRRKAGMHRQLRVAFACRKGGTGKTTCAVGAASMVAHHGYSVLLVDMDPQANATFGLGLELGAPGIADRLLGQSAEPIATAQPGLFVLPGGPLLLQRDVLELESDDLGRVVGHLPFDVVIFDCPPGERRLETWAIRSSALVGIVLDHHDYAIMGAQRVMDQIEYFEADQQSRHDVRMVLNKVDVRRRADRDLADRVRELWPQEQQISIRQDVRLSTATMEGTPFALLSASARGPGFDDLNGLAKWIVAAAKLIERSAASIDSPR